MVTVCNLGDGWLRFNWVADSSGSARYVMRDWLSGTLKRYRLDVLEETGTNPTIELQEQDTGLDVLDGLIASSAFPEVGVVEVDLGSGVKRAPAVAGYHRLVVTAAANARGYFEVQVEGN